MPHVTLEYSAPIGDAHDVQALCDAVFTALEAHTAIPGPSSLKIRALPCPDWRIGTDPGSFAHADLILLPGRDDATKADLARVILDTMQSHLPDIGSLSVDVSDLSPAYVKRVL